tara:strand:+ start:665 stop:769 length:105 start_codon:yes stop_codon:yes gene_type:complete
MECIGEKSKDKICGKKGDEENHEMVKKEISKEST